MITFSDHPGFHTPERKTGWGFRFRFTGLKPVLFLRPGVETMDDDYLLRQTSSRKNIRKSNIKMDEKSPICKMGQAAKCL